MSRFTKTSHHYKLRNTKTGEYWAGVGTAFNKDGCPYFDLDRLASDLEWVKKMFVRHPERYDFIADCVIVGYKTKIEEVSDSSLAPVLATYQFHSDLTKQYGKTFLAQIGTFVRTFKYQSQKYPERGIDPLLEASKYKWAIEVKSRMSYRKLTKELSELGFNSRSFRKTPNWVWIDNEVLITTIRLMGDYVVKELNDVIPKFIQAAEDMRLTKETLTGSVESELILEPTDSTEESTTDE